MAAKTEEFVNPKSMVTPGFAATIVATIAGALFTMFGIALPATLIILSFFVGCIVFHSKEFADPKMRRWSKAFFYILNSLIIFAMATGTHSVLDQRKSSHAEAGIPFIRAVYAQEIQPGCPVLKQERPFFYDWTTATPRSEARPGDKVIVRFMAEQDFGKVKGFFVSAGLVMPTYKMQLEIDKAKLPGEIKSVTWHLPEYFAKKTVTVSEGTKNCGVSIDAWQPFAIGADVELMSGEKFQLEKFLSFDPQKN